MSAQIAQVARERDRAQAAGPGGAWPCAALVLICIGCGASAAPATLPVARWEQSSPGPAAAAFVDRCQADVQREMNAHMAPDAVRFEPSPVVTGTATRAAVQGDAVAQSPNGPERRYTYFCSFRVDERGQLSHSEYQPD
jgi:hypothetical protein